MPANWTTPKTWNTGDPLIATDMNTHIRDNFEFIKSPPTAAYKANEAVFQAAAADPAAGGPGARRSGPAPR